jgi:hypothetical protein
MGHAVRIFFHSGILLVTLVDSEAPPHRENVPESADESSLESQVRGAKSIGRRLRFRCPLAPFLI